MAFAVLAPTTKPEPNLIMIRKCAPLSRSLVPSFVVSLSQSVFAARRGELLRLLRVTDDSRARSASFGLDDSVAEKLINQYTHAI